MSETHKAEHYDYEKQAWIGTDGRYLSCAHPADMNCKCYGRLHYGELAPMPQPKQDIREWAGKYAAAVLINLPDDYDARKRIISSAIVKAVGDALESKQAALRGIVASLSQNAIYPADIAYALSIAQDEIGQSDSGKPQALRAEEIRAKVRI